MILFEKAVTISKPTSRQNLLQKFRDSVLAKLPENEFPIRIVITSSDEDIWNCELGVMSEFSEFISPEIDLIFQFKQRNFENTEQFNCVLVVPTGVDAEIGGDAGDAGPVARLLASTCDNLITHPNVVNASDINELPENSLYVEGSVLSRLMMGTIGLQKVRSNRLLVVLDKSNDPFFHEAATNSVSAARANLGLNCVAVALMDDKISMTSLYSNSGRAVGSITHFEKLYHLLNSYIGECDAVALSSTIKVPPECHADYFTTDMINPWGGVEAMLTHAISSLYHIPSAHSPMLENRSIMNLDVGVVDPRKAAEATSTTYLHCILKGLHKSPRIVQNPRLDGQSGLITVSDISCLVIPVGCVGLPTLAAIEQGIPVIAVKENTNRMQNRLEDLPFTDGQLHVVENYLEAVGVVQAMKAGVAIDSIRRPMRATEVIDSKTKAVSVAVDEQQASADLQIRKRNNNRHSA